jgi:hypothetical protein
MIDNKERARSFIYFGRLNKLYSEPNLDSKDT